ncbi:hypothetical protein [Rhizobium hidalgonense]|uniref:hypothetical protein n=1 Tax=Rhizobium hidalgonense TaxID=1538159 RepID=UPI002871FD38|nr:hypothetical protein [Rhizobium hidalgonense]MDR9813089.1 hypothetical protein [Rhizobium hidalgonense]
MHSHEQKRDAIQTIIDNTRGWLATFGEGAKKRPQHEIDLKQRRLDVLKEIRDDYENAIERKRGAA